MNQILVAIHASFLIAGSGVDDRPVGEHGPPFVRDIQEIAMAFLALLIFERGVSREPGFLVIVFVLGEMNDDVFDAVRGLGVEKVERIMGGR